MTTSTKIGAPTPRALVILRQGLEAELHNYTIAEGPRLRNHEAAQDEAREWLERVAALGQKGQPDA